MSQVNINGDLSDPHYRYKMPAIKSCPQKNLTIITNLAEISRALQRQPDYLLEYFNLELKLRPLRDAQKHTTYAIRDFHDTPKLAKLLRGFINTFVLCSSCSNPETNIVFEGKNSLVCLSCEACGKVVPIAKSHKLCNYIKKFPPSNLKSNQDYEKEFLDYLQKERDPMAVEVAVKANDLNIGPTQMGFLVVQALLGVNITSQFSKYKNFLMELSQSGELLPVQQGFMQAIEHIVTVTKPELISRINDILSGFYMYDIIQEEVFYLWHTRYNRDNEMAKKVREVANPFIKWLK